MKLKYYMRGLGIGIVLTTLIFVLANPKEKLTDREIIERAQTLGMVTKVPDNTDLDKVLDKLKLTGTPAVTKAAVQTSVTPIAEPTQAPTKAPTPEPTKAATPTPKPVNTDSSKAVKVTFEIRSGMSSGQVAALLKTKGLIKNADDFNQYIVDKGKASIIRVGSYTVSSKASYDDIIKAITTKQ